jgi:hypothetical protein
MAEPVSSGAGAVAIKMHGIGDLLLCDCIGLFSCCNDANAASRSEWVVSLITTVMVVLQVVDFYSIFRMHDYNNMGRVCAVGGFSLLQVAVLGNHSMDFNYVNARENATILDVAKEVKDFKDNF